METQEVNANKSQSTNPYNKDLGDNSTRNVIVFFSCLSLTILGILLLISILAFSFIKDVAFDSYDTPSVNTVPLESGTNTFTVSDEVYEKQSHPPESKKSEKSVFNNINKVNETTSSTSSVEAYCIDFEIKEGEFKSKGCYEPNDWDDLQFYLSKYKTAQFKYDSAKGTADFVCDGSDFFKESCDTANSAMESARGEITQTRIIIKSIIDS